MEKHSDKFGVLESLVSNNGLHFDSKTFRKFCSDLDIKNRYSTSAYPQSNGQAKATNKTIVNGLKKMLEGTTKCFVGLKNNP